MDEITFFGVSATAFADKAFLFIVALVITFVVQRILVRITRKMLDVSSIPSASIFVNLLRVLIWSVALLAVLKPVFGIDPTWLVTTIGVVSIAVSLGMQDTISNIVSGFALMVAHVIKPGDGIIVDAIQGRVIDVTWRSTTVRTRDGNLHIIPNSRLNKTSLTHLTHWAQTLCKVSLVVSSSADLEAVSAEIEQLTRRALGDALDSSEKIDVRFSSLAAVGTEGVVRFHIKDTIAWADATDKVTRALHGQPWLAEV